MPIYEWTQFYRRRTRLPVQTLRPGDATVPWQGKAQRPVHRLLNADARRHQHLTTG